MTLKAMEKGGLEIDAQVTCPNDDCTGNCNIEFSRKSGKVKIACVVCGYVVNRVVPYGAGAVIGTREQ